MLELDELFITELANAHFIATNDCRLTVEDVYDIDNQSEAIYVKAGNNINDNTIVPAIPILKYYTSSESVKDQIVFKTFFNTSEEA